MSKSLKEIENELAPLYQQLSILNKNISKINEKKQLINNNNKDFISDIPTDLKKITKEQWEWIFAKNNIELDNEIRHNFRSNILLQLGFDQTGFFEETNQVHLSINEHNFNPHKLKKALNLSKNI